MRETWWKTRRTKKHLVEETGERLKINHIACGKSDKEREMVKKRAQEPRREAVAHTNSPGSSSRTIPVSVPPSRPRGSWLFHVGNHNVDTQRGLQRVQVVDEARCADVRRNGDNAVHHEQSRPAKRRLRNVRVFEALTRRNEVQCTNPGWKKRGKNPETMLQGEAHGRKNASPNNFDMAGQRGEKSRMSTVDPDL